MHSDDLLWCSLESNWTLSNLLSTKYFQTRTHNHSYFVLLISWFLTPKHPGLQIQFESFTYSLTHSLTHWKMQSQLSCMFGFPFVMSTLCLFPKIITSIMHLIVIFYCFRPVVNHLTYFILNKDWQSDVLLYTHIHYTLLYLLPYTQKESARKLLVVSCVSSLETQGRHLHCSSLKFHLQCVSSVFSPDSLATCWYILLSGSVFVKEHMYLARCWYVKHAHTHKLTSSTHINTSMHKHFVF